MYDMCIMLVYIIHACSVLQWLYVHTAHTPRHLHLWCFICVVFGDSLAIPTSPNIVNVQRTMNSKGGCLDADTVLVQKKT